MSLFSTRHYQDGAIFVEAALILPLLLLVTFAGMFFFMCAARQFSLQMAAHEMAKDLALALHGPDRVGRGRECIADCKLSNLSQYPWADFNETPSNMFTVDVDAYVTFMYRNQTQVACWSACAGSRYLLPTPGNGRTYVLSVTARVYPVANWYDQEISNVSNVASPGDYFMITLSCPLRAILGEGIIFFGLLPNTSLVGTAVGVLEKRV